MTPSPENQARIARAVAKVIEAAEAAVVTPALDDKKRALNAVWFAVHDAQQTLNTVERETREAALSAVEGQAA